MKQAYELVVGINYTYIQIAACKSPTTKEVFIEDIEDLPVKLTEQGICNSFYVLHRNTQRTIIDTLLYRHNPRRKERGFMCSVRNCLSLLSF